jgi:hypothetical protein
MVTGPGVTTPLDPEELLDTIQHRLVEITLDLKLWGSDVRIGIYFYRVFTGGGDGTKISILAKTAIG